MSLWTNRGKIILATIVHEAERAELDPEDLVTWAITELRSRPELAVLIRTRAQQRPGPRRLVTVDDPR